MARRHRVRIVEDAYDPLPVKAEPVAPHLCHGVEPWLVQRPPAAGEPETVGEEPAIIDESERRLSAGDLYTSALAGLPESNPPGRSERRVGQGGVPGPRIRLWGAGTSGTPRRGSRAVRLYHAEIEEVFESVRCARPAGLALDASSIDLRSVLGELELHGRGTLTGAFATRSAAVRVSLRVCRFNAMFTAVELKLESRRHPRRFFAAAHDALGSLVASPPARELASTVVT
jgi:hypothetical protein